MPKKRKPKKPGNPRPYYPHYIEEPKAPVLECVELSPLRHNPNPNRRIIL